jgi:hypothetical protein
MPLPMKGIGDGVYRQSPCHKVLTGLIPSRTVGGLSQGPRCLTSGDATLMMSPPRSSRMAQSQVIMTRLPYRCAVGLMIKTDQVSEQLCGISIQMMTLDEDDIISCPSKGLPPLMDGWHRLRSPEDDTTLIVCIALFNGRGKCGKSGGANRVRTLFTSVRNEADRVGPTSPIGFTHVGSLALRAHSCVPYGSGGWST